MHQHEEKDTQWCSEGRNAEKQFQNKKCDFFIHEVAKGKEPPQVYQN